MNKLREIDQRALGEVELVECIGTSQAETWRALNHNGQDVIVKIYRFEDSSEWKGLDLFNREIQVLQQLRHDGIPKYLARAESELEDGLNVYLVQELVTGQTLEKYRPRDSEEVEKIARGVLEILVYLQSFSPPVIHRDIKPANIMYDGERVSLIDFGAVQLVTPSDEGGSTIVGTSGYMPFEQLMGRASPASDLYGLGMTLVHLVTGRPPDTLPVVGMRTIWEDSIVIRLTEPLQEFIRGLTEPISEDRFADAKNALESLGLSRRQSLIRAPQNPNAVILETKGALRIQAPKRSLVVPKGISAAVILGVVFTVLFAKAYIVIAVLIAVIAIPMIWWSEITRPIELVVLPKRWKVRSKLGILDDGKHDALVGVTQIKVAGEDQGLLAFVSRNETMTTLVRIGDDEEKWLNATIRRFIAAQQE